MAAAIRKLHTVMVTHPYQGHIKPFVILAIKIADNDFIITFVNSQSIHCRIARARGTDARAIFVGARKSGFNICYATVSDGFPLGFDRSINHDQFMQQGSLTPRAAMDWKKLNMVLTQTFY